MIKPIETIYNGYRFRSRLEARWAVFFDAAGIEYKYEAEGFDLGDGVYYLPDFYLPKRDLYVEVKAPGEWNTNDVQKIVKFHEAGKEVFCVSDFPNLDNFKGTLWKIYDNSHSQYNNEYIPMVYSDLFLNKKIDHAFEDFHLCFFKADEYFEDPQSCYQGNYAHLIYKLKDIITDLSISLCFNKTDISDEIEDLSKIEDRLNDKFMKKFKQYVDVCFYGLSIEKAKQARFEHGEKPF